MTAWAPESPKNGGRCMAVISSCPPAEQLEPEWRELETRSAGSVFLSWPWIGTILTHLGPDSMLVRVRDSEKLVGLGLLGIQKRRFFSLRPPSLHLNETGDPVRDKIMIEYNGLLTEEGLEEDVAENFLKTVVSSQELDKRDLHLSGVIGKWGARCLRHGLTTRLTRPPQAAPFAALQTMPTCDFLATMTRNSRQQIRRSMRYYEERGALTLDRAKDAPQALEWLDALEVLHTRSWRHRGKKGAFSDSTFKNFHRQLILNGFAEGVPDILRARAGDTILGYLYNLRWRGVVCSYQSGFHYEQGPHARPGLVTHVLAMQQYRKEGMSIYRFLAGDARYKNSLATDKDELFWVVAYRPSMTRWLAETTNSLYRAFIGYE
ncbi:GNAT family N-acetyltransferase [Telmatospirillum sp.]|uniref:GNAT family N-acetyltransferase n=1 Tax=Telmatospirillum sp. TaxID=2079197 RepID=UPI00285086B9|nr:GNAT family N-acetyltransferase [Telmatospirillum sp.]MDR3437873.1 GNAT family N-acetyltransferase [Telmatospirillum sp.]